MKPNGGTVRDNRTVNADQLLARSHPIRFLRVTPESLAPNYKHLLTEEISGYVSRLLELPKNEFLEGFWQWYVPRIMCAQLKCRPSDLTTKCLRGLELFLQTLNSFVIIYCGRAADVCVGDMGDVSLNLWIDHPEIPEHAPLVEYLTEATPTIPVSRQVAIDQVAEFLHHEIEEFLPTCSAPTLEAKRLINIQGMASLYWRMFLYGIFAV